MSHVIDYVKKNGWNSLFEDFGIKIKSYDIGLKVLNYDQIKSPMYDPIVKECRGLILDEKLNVVSRPFDRFYNYHETKDKCTNNIDVYEKADGTLIRIYWCYLTDKWEIGTRGTAFGEGRVVSSNRQISFRELILETMKLDEKHFQEIMSSFKKELTYVMEFISPENLIITPYKKSELVLLGLVYNQREYQERSFETVRDYKNRFQKLGLDIRLPEIYHFDSVEEAIESASFLPDLKEGYVAFCRETGVRMKIKSPKYVAFHHMKGNFSEDNAIKLVLMNESSEFLSYFPEYEDDIRKYQILYKEFRMKISEAYEKVKDIENNKDFSKAVSKFNTKKLFFDSRNPKNKGKTPLQIFDGKDIKEQVKIFKLTI